MYVNANEQNNIISEDNDIIKLDDAEKILWYHVLSSVLTLEYAAFTYSTVQFSTIMVYSRYPRITDGLDRTYNKYVHVRVGHTYSARDMIRVRI